MIQTQFVDRSDRRGRDTQGDELVELGRPKALLLQVGQEAVLRLNVRVRYSVADLNAFSSQFTTTRHAYSSPSRFGLSSERGPLGPPERLEVPMAEVAIADISVAKLRSWR